MSTVFRKIFKIYWKILDNSNNAYYYNYNNIKKIPDDFFQLLMHNYYQYST